ncbi:hypothetical protein HDV05_002596 [Chytridiales sp. JEL 0842]|nr:hypothetical protein HDV05_002596 [Chytridiales sp. JEL 0842]
MRCQPGAIAFWKGQATSSTLTTPSHSRQSTSTVHSGDEPNIAPVGNPNGHPVIVFASYGPADNTQFLLITDEWSSIISNDPNRRRNYIGIGKTDPLPEQEPVLRISDPEAFGSNTFINLTNISTAYSSAFTLFRGGSVFLEAGELERLRGIVLGLLGIPASIIYSKMSFPSLPSCPPRNLVTGTSKDTKRAGENQVGLGERREGGNDGSGSTGSNGGELKTVDNATQHSFAEVFWDDITVEPTLIGNELSLPLNAL